MSFLPTPLIFCAGIYTRLTEEHPIVKMEMVPLFGSVSLFNG